MSVETKLAGAAPLAISRGICFLMEPTCKEGCGGGGNDRIGNGWPAVLTVCDLGLDPIATEGISDHPLKWVWAAAKTSPAKICRNIAKADKAAAPAPAPASGISHPAGWIIGIILAFFILD